MAKDVFEVALANRVHRIIDRKRLTRRQFDSFIDGLSAGTTVVMEACGTAHYWGRRCQARGLRVRLLPVQYVRPYVRRVNVRHGADHCSALIAALLVDVHQMPSPTT